MPLLGAGGGSGGCRQVTAGLGDMPLTPGTVLQLRMHISALSPHPAFVTGSVGQSDIEGVFKRLSLCHPKWTRTFLPGLTALIKTDMVKELGKCLVI